MASQGVPPLLIAFYEDHEHPQPVLETYQWPELVLLLTEHEFTACTPCPGGQKCKEKFTLAFSPGAPKAGTRRLDKNVESVSLLVYDFDHLPRAELEGIIDRLAGLECVLYSTHSHLNKGADDCCVRIVFPLARALAPHEFRFLHRTVIAKYALQWYREGQPPKLVGADPNPKDISRLYFMPTAPEGVEVEAGHQEGALLELDEMLKDLPRPSAPARPLRVVAPPGSAPIAPPTIDMVALRGLLKGYKPPHPERDEGEVIARKELVRRVYEDEPLVRAEEEGQREKACHRLGKILAYLLPPGTPDEAAVELVRKSISTMPVYDSDGEDDTLEKRFAKFEYSLRRGLDEKAEQDAAFEEERAKEKQGAEKLRHWLGRARRGLPRGGDGNAGGSGGVPPHSPGGGDGDGGGGGEPGEPEEENAPLSEEEVRELLRCKMTKQGPVPFNFLANVIILLSLHPEWEGKLRYNEITKNVEVDGGPLAAYELAPSQIVSGVKNWLNVNFDINFSTADVLDGLVHVAKGNAHNPLRWYLEHARSDKTPRIDTFLETYCGASLLGVDNSDISGYVRKVSRRWLIAAVARALDPGCKMDNVLILEGKTGIYKSTALRALGGEFFSDSKVTIGEKDAMQLAGTNWIHEIAELSGFHAAETEQQKAFFSSSVDQFRAPYDKVPEKYPRLAVFVGSTNDDRYLNDPTGNRRYLPIRCEHPFRIQQLRNDRDLIWAEATQVYKAAATCLKCQAMNVGTRDWFTAYAHERCAEHRWWFDGAENEDLERINNHRLKADYADGIRDYLLRLSPTNRSPSYTIFQIATDMLKLQPNQISSQSSAIGRALKVLKFTKERLREDGGSQTWLHVVPEFLAKAPKKMPAHLKVVQGSAEETK